MKYVSKYKIGTLSTTYIFGNGQQATDVTEDYRLGLEQVIPAGTVVGNFKDPTPWGYEVFDKRYLYGKVHRQFGGYQTIVEGPVYAPSYENADINVPDFDDPILLQKALSRLNEKVRGSLDLSIALAESGSTIRMNKAAASLPRYVRDFKALRSVRTFSKLAANSWLEFTYGWKPLVQDLYAAADESIRVVINKLERFKASANDRNFPDTTQTLPVYNYAPGVPITAKYSGIRGYRIVMDLQHPEHDIARWTSLNPASIAWELMPYSFVIDWVYDIGTTLRNFETALLYGANFRGGYIDHLLAIDAEAIAINAGSGDLLYFTGKATLRYRKFNRTVLTAYPYQDKPTFKVSLGSSRLLSAAALLRQLIK